MAEQNFANHAKWVAGYHFFVIPALLLNIGSSIYRWVKLGFTIGGLIGVIVALALLLLAFYARIFALTVQNRVIRLEERIRCERLLPDDLKPRIGELSTSQLIAMRFASDAELPTLARKVLNDKVTEGKAIKQMIQQWRPDYLRA